MKSEERHKLKSNELAQSLMGIPAYFREHGKKWIIVLVICLVVLVGSMVFRSSRLVAQENRSYLLQSLIAETKKIQHQAAQSAQSGEQSDDLLIDSFDDSAGPLANSLSVLTQEGSGTPVTKTALLQKARLLRSQLFYTNIPLSSEKRQDLLNQVESIYHTVLQQYPHDVIASGMAKMGLALVAEDRLQWDQARDAYQAILDDAQSQWAGTIFPSQARQRLEAISDLESEPEIVFEWTEELPVTELTQGETMVTPIPVEKSDKSVAPVKDPVVHTEVAPGSEEN